MDNEAICIIDYAGNYKYPGFWCDYFPHEQIVKFGGDWYDIPSMKIDHQPTDDECYKHVEKCLGKPYTQLRR